ncbi:MAG: cytochrome c biogenesis CcdA family protein [Methanobacteriota archaeon]
MTLDAVLVGFAYSAGAASFFSPCAVGLLPAYVAYYLGTDRQAPGSARISLASGVLHGAGLGIVSSAGFFALFLAVGLVVSAVGTAILGPYLVWTSRIIGAAIAIVGLALVFGRSFSMAPRLRFTPRKSAGSLFGFGIAYGIASLGCTLPVFLAVVLGSFASGSSTTGLLALVAYAAGMSSFMVTLSILLGASKETAKAFLSRAVPVIERGSALVMVAAGAYILYYYTVVIA